MPTRRVSMANALRFAAAAVAIALTIPSASAADLPRHHYRHHHRSSGLTAYRDDRVCPLYEPRDYHVRTVNDPLCYAVRPYGISLHLYDRSTLLDRVDDSPDAY